MCRCSGRDTSVCLDLYAPTRRARHDQRTIIWPCLVATEGSCIFSPRENVRIIYGLTTETQQMSTIRTFWDPSHLPPIRIRYYPINVQNVPQVSDIGLPGLESLVTITACGSHTPPSPLYFITTAWSVLEIITISFSFVYFIYHAVNFILCSLSDV